MTKIIVSKNDEGQSLFKFIKKCFSTTSLSVIYKWFRTNKIKVNSKKINNDSHKLLLKEGDVVMVFDYNNKEIRDKKINYDGNIPDIKIMYEDENILIIDKPENIEVHSPINLSLDLMVKNYLKNTNQYNPLMENSFVVSHVHRLDKLTRGLIIYAKNAISLTILNKIINDKDKIVKTYSAVVEGNIFKKQIINGWIYYDEHSQKAIFDEKQDMHRKAKTAILLLDPQMVRNNKTFISIALNTGRKHQIRATMDYLKHPILNDFRYGAKKINNEKMIFLFATELNFIELPEPLNYLNGKKFRLDVNIDWN
ncbi:RluA family pseudouridine synthase [Spiroplasma endosymbiont of Labia minor]|uniref:pseudouridine synthase family protein n=1 Tax=Spiroplasma endosymbiont of Labia minor TaxID=3066305 RepID=UPI0030D20ED8